MTTDPPGDIVHSPDDSQLGDLPVWIRFRRGVPRWISIPVCCVSVGWACLKLYDYQHPAAWAARQLWSPRRTDRVGAIHELEGSGRVDTEVAIPALIRALKDPDAGRVRAQPWPWSRRLLALTAAPRRPRRSFAPS